MEMAFQYEISHGLPSFSSAKILFHNMNTCSSLPHRGFLCDSTSETKSESLFHISNSEIFSLNHVFSNALSSGPTVQNFYHIENIVNLRFGGAVFAQNPKNYTKHNRGFYSFLLIYARCFLYNLIVLYFMKTYIYT